MRRSMRRCRCKASNNARGTAARDLESDSTRRPPLARERRPPSASSKRRRGLVLPPRPAYGCQRAKVRQRQKATVSLAVFSRHGSARRRPPSRPRPFRTLNNGQRRVRRLEKRHRGTNERLYEAQKGTVSFRTSRSPDAAAASDEIALFSPLIPCSS